MLVGAAFVRQQHRAVIYLCWPHGSWSEGLSGALISARWAGRLLPPVCREEKQSGVGWPPWGGSLHSQALPSSPSALPRLLPDLLLLQKNEILGKVFETSCPEKILERQWVEIQMFPGRNPLIFCSQLVSIFPSWDELCFSLSRFFVLGLNQHCILNRLLCLHFKSPLGWYSCYLDGFYSFCCAHWPHQNKWLSRELDCKTALSVDAQVRMFCEPVFFSFF